MIAGIIVEEESTVTIRVLGPTIAAAQLQCCRCYN